MSIKIMAEVWERAWPHNYVQSVLLALADHADAQGGSVYPSLARIAWKTGYSERHVRRAISYLRNLGVLIVVASPRQHRPTEYRIDLSRAPLKPPFRGGTPTSGLDLPLFSGGTPEAAQGGHPRPAREDTGVRSEPSQTSRGDTGVHPGGTPTSPESSVKHQVGVKANRQETPPTSGSGVLQITDFPDPLVQEIQELGVRRKVAQELVTTADPDVIHLCCAYVRRAQQTRSPPESPAGLVISMIRDGERPEKERDTSLGAEIAERRALGLL